MDDPGIDAKSRSCRDGLVTTQPGASEGQADHHNRTEDEDGRNEPGFGRKVNEPLEKAAQRHISEILT